MAPLPDACNPRLLSVFLLLLLDPVLRLHHVVGERVLLGPLRALARVEVGRRREQHVLKVLHVHLERVALAAHVDKDLDDLLDELAGHFKVARGVRSHYLRSLPNSLPDGDGWAIRLG